MDHQKKLLVVSYLYPPSQEVGAIRVSEFVKYLPENGWKSFVVTSREGASENYQDPKYVFRTGPTILESMMAWFRRTGRQVGPYKFSKETGIVQSSSRLGSLIGRIVVVWLRSWWAIKVLPLAIKVAFREKISVIYVNCGPFAQTLTGLILKLIMRKPLVFDFRDAWSLDPYGQFSGLGKIWVQIWEKLVVSVSDALIVTSPSAEAAYKKLYKKQKDKIYLICNGYDEELFKDLDYSRSSEDKTIAYAGTIYPERARAFFPALAKNPKVILNIYGRIFNPDEFWKLAESMGVRSQIKFHGHIDRQNLFNELLKNSSLLLTQDYSIKSTVTPIAGKTFEYLRLGLPILALVPEGDNAQIIRTTSNSIVLTSDNVEEITKALAEVINLPPNKSMEKIVPYRRFSLTQDFATLLSELVLR